MRSGGRGREVEDRHVTAVSRPPGGRVTGDGTGHALRLMRERLRVIPVPDSLIQSPALLCYKSRIPICTQIISET